MTAQPPQQLLLRSGELTLPLPALPSGSCLRVIGTHPNLLELALLDAQDTLIASDTGFGFALLDPAGPLCFQGIGGFRLRLRGQGEAWIQLWSAPPS